MKRIIFYAAAVGIFISSVLAKPARGAAPPCAAGCGNVVQEQGSEWFPGQGSWMAQTPEVQAPETQAPGAEWFPGQGPDAGQTPEVQTPGTQTPGAEWFPGQGPDAGQMPEVQAPETQAPGAEWFPGQGPAAGESPDIQEPDTQLPDLQSPWTSWFPWLGGQNRDFWQQDGDWKDFWLWNGSGQGNNSQSGGQNNGQNSGQNNGQNSGQNNGQNNGGAGQQPGTGTGGQSGDGGEMASYITRIVELVNVQRAAAGLSPVTASAALSAAADVRAQEIVGNFSHYRPNGTYFNTVLDQRGISYNGAGENIAYGYDTPERVMTEWMNSAGHRANILDSRYTKLGVGYYEQGGVKYWTQMFTY